ncbi:MAG: elongator complex protein 3 [Syntrophales bacterium]
MTWRIIPLFIMYSGCPYRCIYCNERIAAGDHPPNITEEFFNTVIENHLRTFRTADRIQIAFYGGNFTGMPEDYQVELLTYARPYIERGLVHSVRISTRPDYINPGRLKLLEDFSVRTVELGAQSMSDEVLRKSNRTHSAAQVRDAIALLKERGFETGIHLMAGLPGDSMDGFLYSVEEVISLRPDMARVHPTIVFRDTPLAGLYLSGDYTPLSLDDAVVYCKHALNRFTAEGIPVIRLGLQMNPAMEKPGVIIAGPFHPAFRSLVESAVFLDRAFDLIGSLDTHNASQVTFFMCDRDISYFRGMENRNLPLIRERIRPAGLRIKADPSMKRGTLAVSVDH